MADTDIEWATKVWNVTRGCRRVSPGCGGPGNQGGCYAERQAIRMSGPGGAYEGLVEPTLRGPRWTGKGLFVAEKLEEPLRWRQPRDGSRHRIFVDSMSDLFFEEFTNEQIAAVFGVMAACQEHDFLILTKRAERLREWFDWITPNEQEVIADHLDEQLIRHGRGVWDRDRLMKHFPYDDWKWPLPWVWLGVSAEDQQRADERIPHLLATPAAVRFVSAEPLIGPIDLSRFMWPMCWHWASPYRTPEEAIAAGAYAERKRQALVSAHAVFLDWVIVGSESGQGARPMAIEWAESLRDQCAAAGVAFFTKQIANERDRKGGKPEFWPAGPWPREFPEARP